MIIRGYLSILEKPRWSI